MGKNYEFWRQSLHTFALGAETVKADESSNTIYITVPKASFLTDEAGKEMAGEHLAEYVKAFLTKYDSAIRVKYRIRDEEWTQFDYILGKRAEKDALKAIEEMLSGYKEV